MADETATKKTMQVPKKAPENPESALSSVNKMLQPSPTTSTSPYQKVRMLFVPKQSATTTPKLSIQHNWVYYLDKPPIRTISMTLSKFKFEKVEETAPKYRIYRVREDPKTRYRYVTEILNIDEGRQLISGMQRKGTQVLITHHSMVRNPQEDFKNLLDEAERTLIRQRGQKTKEEAEAEESDGHVWEAMKDGQDPEPATQSQGALATMGIGASQDSDSSSLGGSQDKTASGAPRMRKPVTNKRAPSASGAPVDASTDIFSSPEELARFKQNYPLVEFCGRQNDLYRCDDALQFIKDTSRQQFADLRQLQNQLINPLNKMHRKMTAEGNAKVGNDVKEIYEHRITSSYINVRCKISKKCRFMVWYKFEGPNDNPAQIVWFRSINNNHDLAHHRNEGIF